MDDPERGRSQAARRSPATPGRQSPDDESFLRMVREAAGDAAVSALFVSLLEESAGLTNQDRAAILRLFRETGRGREDGT
jgi:hypothetical protein